jgi:hypothetical protein
MITAKELRSVPVPGRTARNLARAKMPTMGRNGANNARYSAIQELAVRDERIPLSGLGEGETLDRAVAVTPVVARKTAAPSWLKWAGIAAAAGLAYYFFKKLR